MHLITFTQNILNKKFLKLFKNQEHRKRTTQSGGAREGVWSTSSGATADRNEVKYSANGWPTEVENLL